MQQGLTVQDGKVIEIFYPYTTLINPNSFIWDGDTVSLGDPDPRSADEQFPNYQAYTEAIQLMNSLSPVPFAVQKWLELYGDWLNDLNLIIKGTTRSRDDLINDWLTRMKQT